MRKNTLRQPGRTGVVWSTLKGVCLSAALGIGLSPATAAAQSNPIVIENQQPGTSQWRIPFGSAATDGVGQIKGYASATSVNKGGNITFFVSTNPSQTYTIDVYRIGWYQGLGGRLIQHIDTLSGVQQPTCPTDATTGMIECHWAAAYTLATQTSWTSGIYLALLTNAQGYQNYIVFVVRDDSRIAALLYQQPVTTYQAYNDYPYDNATGKSLYGFNSYGATTVTGGTNAAKVSFDRPYLGDGTGIDWGASVFSWEINFVRWMEKSGYDVTYSTDIDTHTDGARLLNYRGFLSVGHDEYWSKPMYDAVVAARDAGVNLAFFGANAIYWQVRLESSSSGVPNRVLVCYRNASIDPVADPSLKTVNWRDSVLNRPEQTLIGVQYTDQVQYQPQTGSSYVPYVVTNSGSWVYAGTGFKDGDSVPGIVGYEADRLFSQYPQPNAVSGTYTLLSHSPFPAASTPSDYANSSIYQAPSGAWVFGAGTFGWNWALDDFLFGAKTVDARLQQTTANILNRFVQQSDFTLSASPSSGTVTQGGSTKYSVTITPTGGFTDPVTLSVSAGLPSGASGSFDPNPATASSTLSVTTSSSTPTGAYTLTIKGVSSSGTLTHTTTVSLVVNPPPDFTLSASPASRTVIQGGPTTYGVTITPTGGFTDPVTLSVSGLPSGADGSFTPNPATGASSTLSVTTKPSTPAGTYTLTIQGVSGSGTLTHTTTVSLVVNVPPDFTLSASPASRTVIQGGPTSYGVTISPTGGFTDPVTLSVSAGLPSGASGSFTPNPATASSTLSVTTSASTPTGTYTLTIQGVSGSGTLTHTTTVTLVVNPPPDFTLSASPASRTLGALGGSTSYSVTISPTGGFSGQVTLSVSGLPPGATGSFSPNPATASSTLSVTTPPFSFGTYTLTIKGVSGTLTHTTTVELVVNVLGF
jgi:uncharacterized membrane protein